MKSTIDKCRIDGVAFGEIHIELVGKTDMKGRYALVNSSTGERFGGGEAPHHFWGEETHKRLAALIESMEEDLLSLVFEHKSPEGSEGAVVAADLQDTDAPGF